MKQADFEGLPSGALALVEAGAQALLAGGAVVYPTETFYGLAAAVLVPESVAKIFEIKRRPPDKPLPLIAADVASARTMWASVPDEAEVLMDAFWPGPVTIVLPASSLVPRAVAPFGEVGVRVSPHPVARLLASRVGPIVATSANLSGNGEKTQASALDPSLLAQVSFVLDAGETLGGKPSTVVRLTEGKLQVLREGAVPSLALERALAQASSATSEKRIHGDG